jgi:hypothetical protein
MRGPSGPFQRAVCDTSVSLEHELCKYQNFYYTLSEGEKSTVRDQAQTVQPLGTDRPPVGK